MPITPMRPCSTPGCGRLVESGKCDEHAKQLRQRLDAERGSASSRGYGAKWRKAREAYLRAHPLCQCPECGEGRIRLRPASVVDHIIPHKGDMTLFWDRANWQAMAKQCHDRKTAREDGRWQSKG